MEPLILQSSNLLDAFVPCICQIHSEVRQVIPQDAISLVLTFTSQPKFAIIIFPSLFHERPLHQLIAVVNLK